MRRLTIASVVLLVTVAQSLNGWPTSGWLVVNEKTIEGNWVALDQESGEVWRLRIRGTGALLVMTAGSAQSEFVFRSNTMSVKKGKLSAKMTREPGGWTLEVIGEGRADTMNGLLTLRMHTAKQAFFPGSDHTLAFVKECCQPIVELLAKNDRRARALIEESATGNEPTAPAPAGRSQPGGNSGGSAKTIRDGGPL
jgi:hypothetical protein